MRLCLLLCLLFVAVMSKTEQRKKLLKLSKHRMLCGEGEEPRICRLRCEKTCQQPYSSCGTTCSHPVCVCRKGYYRLSGICVDEESCHLYNALEQREKKKKWKKEEKDEKQLVNKMQIIQVDVVQPSFESSPLPTFFSPSFTPFHSSSIDSSSTSQLHLPTKVESQSISHTLLPSITSSKSLIDSEKSITTTPITKLPTSNSGFQFFIHPVIPPSPPRFGNPTPVTTGPIPPAISKKSTVMKEDIGAPSARPEGRDQFGPPGMTPTKYYKKKKLDRTLRKLRRIRKRMIKQSKN